MSILLLLSRLCRVSPMSLGWQAYRNLSLEFILNSIAMQQRTQTHNKKQRLFTASEVAEFEYCPLAWWHEQFEPLAQVDTEELFARLVELEHEHGSEAPTLPEYRMVEQLLVRKGAFDEGREQHLEHADEV